MNNGFYGSCVVCVNEHDYLATGEHTYVIYPSKNKECLVSVADELNFEKHFNMAVGLMLSKYTIFQEKESSDWMTLFKTSYGDCVPGGEIIGESLYFDYCDMFDTVKSVLKCSGIYLYWSRSDYFEVMEKKQLVEVCNYRQVRICKYDEKAGMLRYAEGVQLHEWE